MDDTTITVKPGRAIEVHEYGDPSGPSRLLLPRPDRLAPPGVVRRRQGAAGGLAAHRTNRPGVGESEFVERRESTRSGPGRGGAGVALRLDEFSVIGISGGAPTRWRYSYRLGQRIRTTTLISGMGPAEFRAGLHGMDPLD